MSMSLQEFEDLLDGHGGNPERWPPARRADANALLVVSAQARAHHAAMRDVERWLEASVPSQSPAADRFAAMAMRHAQDSDRRPPASAVGSVGARQRLGRRTAGWSAAAAAALVLGMVVGGLSPAAHDDNPGQILTSALDSTGSVDVD